jgi:hypothetical protein
MRTLVRYAALPQRLHSNLTNVPVQLILLPLCPRNFSPHMEFQRRTLHGSFSAEHSFHELPNRAVET